MNVGQLLQKLVPDVPKPSHVEQTKEGLQLSDGSTLHWPEDETGVVLRFNSKGEVVGEWWPHEDGYQAMMELFNRYPVRHEIVVGPRLQVVWPDDEGGFR